MRIIKNPCGTPIRTWGSAGVWAGGLYMVNPGPCMFGTSCGPLGGGVGICTAKEAVSLHWPPGGRFSTMAHNLPSETNFQVSKGDTYQLAHVARVRCKPPKLAHAGGVHKRHGKLPDFLQRRAAVLPDVQCERLAAKYGTVPVSSTSLETLE
jgi:hypothetical protein